MNLSEKKLSKVVRKVLLSLTLFHQDHCNMIIFLMKRFIVNRVSVRVCVGGGGGDDEEGRGGPSTFLLYKISQDPLQGFFSIF